MKTYQDITYKFLNDQYTIQQKSIREIAKETGLTKKQIQRLIKKFRIKTRKGRRKGIKKYRPLDILTKDLLYQKYIIENKSIKDISDEMNIGIRCISRGLEYYNIPKRGNSRKGRKNKNPFNYKQDIPVGYTYELLTVIEVKNNKLICKCRCGNVKTLHSSRIRNKQVKSCGCLNTRIGTENPNFKGYGHIPHSVYTKCKTNGSDRNIDFQLSIKDLDTQYQKQKGKCSISGIDIGFNNDRTKTKILSTASLDRIDSSKPYTKDNIQWVHKRVQQMKWTASQEEFIEWCKIIAEHNK